MIMIHVGSTLIHTDHLIMARRWLNGLSAEKWNTVLIICGIIAPTPVLTF